MNIADQHNEEIYQKVRAILAEHFPNFVFCVMDDDGDVYYDYTNIPIGKMLLREMQEDMENEALDNEDWTIEWADEEDGDEWN